LGAHSEPQPNFSQHAKGEKMSNNAGSENDFDPIENGAIADCNFWAVLERCNNFQKRGGLFDAQTERIAEALDIAFCLYCAVKSSPPLLAAVFAELENDAQMKPLPSRKKLELIAVKYVTRPKNGRQHEACSRYANVLVWANANKLTSANFVGTFRATTLERCITFARMARRSKQKPKIPIAYVEVRINDSVHEKRLLRSRINERSATYLWGKLDSGDSEADEHARIKAAIAVLTESLETLARENAKSTSRCQPGAANDGTNRRRQELQ
jgi:hypothetical protein